MSEKPETLQELRQHLLANYIDMKKALPINRGRKHIIIIFSKEGNIVADTINATEVDRQEHIKWNGEEPHPSMTDFVQTAAFLSWCSMTTKQWVQDYLAQHGKAPE